MAEHSDTDEGRRGIKADDALAAKARAVHSEKASQQAHVAVRSSSQSGRKALSGKGTKLGRGKKSQGAFLTIREVSEKLGVQQHVLRFWETKFSQIRPLKRGGGRRYYRPDDVVLIDNIRHFLHEEGYTIKGVQRLLKTEGKSAFSLSKDDRDVLTSTSSPQHTSDSLITLSSLSALSSEDAASTQIASDDKLVLSDLLHELKALRKFIVTTY